MSISLKLEFPNTGQQKVMRFSVDVPIQQVINEIKEKVNFDGADHGLFQPEVTGKSKSRWFKENHTLKFYNLTNDVLVIFKKKHRPIKVQLVDNTLKTVLIDDTAKISVIRDTIARKLGIKSAEEYGLRVVGAKEGNWLNPSVGLYEQDVNENDTVVFDKNFFFFDDIIDRSDPVQLHLVYSKAVQSILTGKYPITQTEVVQLACVQCQVLHTDYNPQVHKVGFLKLHEIVPAQWLADKGRAKKFDAEILDEWKKLIGTNEPNAKYRYVQYVRQLPTYGITFYPCQVPEGKKAKLVPILIGITREKIMKMHPDTKEVHLEYPLIHLKRWAAVRGKFTFDFGDHEDEYWTVLTDEAEAMSSLISGYIDIIINARKQGVRQIEIDQKTSVANEEDAAVAGVAQTGVISTSTGTGGTASTRPGSVRMTDANQQLAEQVAPASSKVQVVDAPSALRLAELLKQELRDPELQNTEAARRSTMGSTQWVDQLVSYEKGTDDDVEQLLNKASDPSKFTKNDLDGIAKALGNRLKGLSAAAVKAANLLGEDAVTTAAAQVAEAVGNLISSAQRLAANPHDPKLQQDLQAAKQRYDDAMILLRSAQNAQMSDDGTVDLVKGGARAVAAQVDEVVNLTKDSLKTVQNPNQIRLINEFVKQVAPAKEALVASATTLASALINPAAKKHIIDAGQFLAGLTNGLNNAVKNSGCNPEFLEKIGAAAKGVNDAIKQLVDSLDTAEDRSGCARDLDKPAKVIAAAMKSLKESGQDQKKLLNAVKAIATAANDVNKQALGVAKTAAPEVKTNLEDGSAKLKAHLTDMTNTGKEALKNPKDNEVRNALLEAAQNVEDDVNSLIADVNNATASVALRMVAKAAAGRGIELATTIRIGMAAPSPAGTVSGSGTANIAARDKMRMEAENIGGAMKGLLDALRVATGKPSDPAAQEALRNAAKNTAPKVAQLVAEVKRNHASGDAATGAANDMQNSLQKMMGAVQNTETADHSGADVSEALKNLDANNSQIEASLFSAQSGLLVPAPGQTRDGAVELLGQFADNLASHVETIARAAQGSGPLGPAASAGVEGVADLITAVEGVASTLNDKEAQAGIFNNLKDLNKDFARFVTAAKATRANKQNPQLLESLNTARADVQRSLGAILAAAKGVETKDIDAAIKSIAGEVNLLKSPGPPAPGSTPEVFSTNAKATAAKAKALNSACQQIVSVVSQGQTRRLGPTAKLMASAAKQLIAAANTAIGSAPDIESGKQMAESVKNVMRSAVAVAENAKSGALTSNKDALETAAQQLGAAVAVLEGTLSGSSVPQINEAIAAIETEQARLEDPRTAKAVPGKGKRAVLRDLDQACASLAGNISRLISAARVGTDKVGIYANETGVGVASIVSSAVAARQPLPPPSNRELDPIAQHFLKTCAEIIANPGNTNVVGPATIQLSKLTKDLAGTARDTAMALNDDKNRQKNYINGSKALSAGVPKLAAAVKANKPALIAKCAEFLQNAVYKMEAARLGCDPEELSEGPDTPLDPAVQEQLANSARAVALAATGFLNASGQVAADPNNAVLSQQMSNSSQALSDSVGSIATIVRDLDPAKLECAATVAELQKALNDIDSAIVNAGVGLLEKPNNNKTHGQLQGELAEILQQLAPEITALGAKEGGESGKDLQTAAAHIRNKLPELVEAVKQTAATAPIAAAGKKILGQAKELTQAMHGLVNECYVSGMNVATHGKTASDCIGELLSQLKTSNEILNELDDLVGKVRKMAESLQQQAQPTGKPYPEIKEAIVAASRAVTAAATSLKTCDMSQVGTVGLQSKTLARSIPALITLVRDALAATPDANAREKVTQSTTALVECVGDLIQQAGVLAKEDNLVNRAEFNDKWNNFTESIVTFLNSIKRGALGESKIDDGADEMTSMINKLNTSAIFASAGQPIEGVKSTNQSYDQLVQSISSSVSEKIPPLAQQLANAGEYSQEELGNHVETFVHEASTLAEQSLQAAERAPDSEQQQNLINGTKAVTISAKQLILSAKDAQKNQNDTTAKATLDSALAATLQAFNTLTTVLRGGKRAAEEFEALRKNMETSMNTVTAASSATAVSVVDSARAVSAAATPLVFASSQDDLLEGANEALSAVQELLSNVKGAAKSAPNVSTELSENAKQVATKMTALLEVAKRNRSDPATGQLLQEASLALHQSLETLVGSVNKMPGGKDLRLRSATDLEASADKDLLAAADLIKRALSSLPQPRTRRSSISRPDEDKSGPPVVVDERSLNDAILYSAREIAETTANLITSASKAAKESNAAGSSKYAQDPTWSHGLKSAAQKVAGGVNRLITAASEAASGKLDEETLIANAKFVAASVKHLVVASNVRGNISPQLKNEISEIAKLVARCTSEVVASAQKAGDFKEQKEVTRKRSTSTFGVSGSVVQKLEQQTAILRLEKQLEEARRGLLAMNKKSYEKK